MEVNKDVFVGAMELVSTHESNPVNVGMQKLPETIVMQHHGSK